VTVYSFELHFCAPPGEHMIDKLYESGWDDAVIRFEPETGGRGSAIFDREASTAVQAVGSAIRQGRNADIELLGVTEDLVTLADIAERTQRTFAAVGHWASGRRGPGGFPEPRVPRPRVSLYSWAEVTVWLEQHGLAKMSPSDVEVAQICEAADAMLRAERMQRRLSKAAREALADAVA
jgi:hypothetical protein